MAVRATCSVCHATKDDVRMWTTSGAYGPVDVQTCEDCHVKEIASVKAESRRFGMRLKVPKPFANLTTKGAFSDVRS